MEAKSDTQWTFGPSEAPTNFIVTTAVIYIIILILQYISDRKKRKLLLSDRDNSVLGVDDIPGAPPLLPSKLIGNFARLLPFSKSVEKGLKWNAEYPGLLKATGANHTFVGLTDPSLIQQLFKSADFGHNVKSSIVYDLMKPFILNGVLVSTGHFWHSQRKLLMRTQRFQALKAYMGMLNRHGKGFVKMLEKLFQDGQPHQLNETINVLFLQVICEMITGRYIYSSKEFDRYHHNFQIWKESLVKRLLNPWLLLNPLWKLHPMSKQQSTAIQEMFDFAKRRFEEHGQQRKECEDNPSSSFSGSHDRPQPAFRSVLDELVDGNVDERQIIDEVNTMLFGGHETGATAIHYFCFCMALNQEIQSKCRQELDELYNDPVCVVDGDITYDAVQCKVKYLEHCILETLRLFPPVFMVFRQLETEFSFTHHNKQYTLPVGTDIAVVPLATHRMPEHFPDPLKFDPDRFLPEEISKRHAYAYIPFSGGPRICLGIKFAMIEMKIVAAYLLRNFVLTTKDKMEDIPMMPFITLTPQRDYTFELIKRDL